MSSFLNSFPKTEAIDVPGLCLGVILVISSHWSTSGTGKSSRSLYRENPNLVRGWSSRGDMRLFLGNFEGAKLDYEKMIELNPELEVSHWRLGIAYFYLEEYDKAARQFQIYHNYDAVDRENGIWRFMSQFKSNGLNAARRDSSNMKRMIVPLIHCSMKCSPVACLLMRFLAT